MILTRGVSLSSSVISVILFTFYQSLKKITINKQNLPEYILTHWTIPSLFARFPSPHNVSDISCSFFDGYHYDLRVRSTLARGVCVFIMLKNLACNAILIMVFESRHPRVSRFSKSANGF